MYLDILYIVPINIMSFQDSSSYISIVLESYGTDTISIYTKITLQTVVYLRYQY